MSYKYFNKTANSISFTFGNDTVSIGPQSYFYSETKVPDLEKMFGPGVVDPTVRGGSISSMNSSPTFLKYDPAGNVLTNVSAITYNADGTVNTYTVEGVTYTLAYTSGLVSSITSVNGTTTITYDGSNRVISAITV